MTTPATAGMSTEANFVDSIVAWFCRQLATSTQRWTAAIRVAWPVRSTRTLIRPSRFFVPA